RHGRLVPDLDLDDALLQLAVLQQAAHALAPLGAAARQQHVEEPLLGSGGGAVTHLGALLLLDHHLGGPHEVADDRVDVAAYVPDLGELRRLDLHEGRAGELREPSRDLGLADARGADEHDVLGRDLGLQLGRQHAPPVVVAQRDRDGPLGPRLADDVAVELGDDLGGREAGRLPDELERGAGGRHGGARARGSGVEGVHQASPSSATGSSPSSCLVTPSAVTVRTVALPLVNTSISAAIARAARPISSALMSVCRSRAVAAACAYGPPDPT